MAWSEPCYLAQSFEPMSPLKRQDWIKARSDDAKRAGAQSVRVTVGDKGETLFEGWTDRYPDMGEPRWQLAKET